MKLDMRHAPDVPGELPAIDIEVLLNGLPVRPAVAFDTDARTVEVIVDGGGGPIRFIDVEADNPERFGNYKGLATKTLRGKVEVFRRLTKQADLPAWPEVSNAARERLDPFVGLAFCDGEHEPSVICRDPKCWLKG